MLVPQAVHAVQEARGDQEALAEEVQGALLLERVQPQEEPVQEGREAVQEVH